MKSESPSFLVPDWPAPARVNAIFTTRLGGVSKPPYASFNLGPHVGDEPLAIAENRALLGIESEPVWLEQWHSDLCLDVDSGSTERRVDASYTRSPGVVLAVLTADCVPILLTSLSGAMVAVIHAGWRGLQNGIVLNSVNRIDDQSLIAWIGPSIGPCHYEVGSEVRDRFDALGFAGCGDNKWKMDLRVIAAEQLKQAGVTQVFGGSDCTYCDETRFFSYRRDGTTGRMAGLIWLD